MAEPRAKGLATKAIAGLGLAAIIAGLMIGGGPGQGRAERRDEARRADLWALQEQLTCLARERGTLSPEITTTEACPDQPSLVDPVTGEAYRIEQIDAENLRLCASFENPPEARPYLDRGAVAEDGCMVMNLPPEAYGRG